MNKNFCLYMMKQLTKIIAEINKDKQALEQKLIQDSLPILNKLNVFFYDEFYKCKE